MGGKSNNPVVGNFVLSSIKIYENIQIVLWKLLKIFMNLKIVVLPPPG